MHRIPNVSRLPDVSGPREASGLRAVYRRFSLSTRICVRSFGKSHFPGVDVLEFRILVQCDMFNAACDVVPGGCLLEQSPLCAEQRRVAGGNNPVDGQTQQTNPLRAGTADVIAKFARPTKVVGV